MESNQSIENLASESSPPARCFLIGFRKLVGEAAATRLAAELVESSASVDEYLAQLLAAWSSSRRALGSDASRRRLARKRKAPCPSVRIPKRRCVVRFRSDLIIQQWLKLLPELNCAADRQRAKSALSRALFTAQSSDPQFASEISPELMSKLFIVGTTDVADNCLPFEAVE